MVDNPPDSPGEFTLRERLKQAGRQYFLIVSQLLMSVAAFVAAAFYIRFLQGQQLPSIGVPPSEVTPQQYVLVIVNATIWLFATYFPLVVAIWVGFKFAARANALMRSAFYEPTSVVPQKDFELIGEAIRKGDPGPITEYIRLASLTGGAGIFQKIGLTGLPLVTLGLVVFFALGVMFSDSNSDTFSAFLDFTKLTLGAFIGSFVQRQVENRSRETELQRAVENITRGPTRGTGDGTPQPRGPTPAPPPVDVAPEPPAPTPPPASDVTPEPPEPTPPPPRADVASTWEPPEAPPSAGVTRRRPSPAQAPADREGPIEPA